MSWRRFGENLHSGGLHLAALRVGLLPTVILCSVGVELAASLMADEKDWSSSIPATIFKQGHNNEYLVV